MFLYVLSIFCFYGCPAQNSGVRLNQSAAADTSSYCISNTSVGKIDLTASVAYIATTIGNGYSVKEEAFNPDGDDLSLGMSYAICQSNNLIMRIVSKNEDPDRIHSIMVFDPRYEISETGIHVGDDIQKLKKHYTINDAYFNIADGLYLMSDSFNGAFLIDLVGNGDKYESFDTLDDGLKIHAIIIRAY